jgi:hypothetical protein
VVGCAARVEAPDGPLPWRVGRTDIAAGALRFADLRRAARVPARSFAPTRPGRYPAYKVGVGVRAGKTVTVRVARRDRGRVSLLYGPRSRSPVPPYRVADGAAAVTFHACAAGHPAFSYAGPVGPQTIFAGAFVVAGARCVHLEVRERGGRRTLRRTVGFGVRRCPR